MRFVGSLLDEMMSDQLAGWLLDTSGERAFAAWEGTFVGLLHEACS